MADPRPRHWPSDDGGFTLIELLVVGVILGILAAISIPTFARQTKHGFEAQMKASLRTVAAGQDTFFVDHSRYGTITEIIADGSPVVRPSGVSLALLSYDVESGFCVQATHESTSGTWFWDSERGGLQPKGTTACPVATGGPPGDSIP